MMPRILMIMLCSLLGYNVTAMAETKLSPQPGQWSTIVAILDNSNNHYLLKTSVHADAKTCVAALPDLAGSIQDAGGKIWTNRERNTINYEKKIGITEDNVKVEEVRCVLEPFSPEFARFLGR